MKVLLTNPEMDELTYYLRAWADKTIEECKNSSNRYYKLYRNKASRKKFESYISKKDIDLILFCGHGEADRIEGIDDNIVDLENMYFLRDKTVYALSCKSAKKLGKESVKSGAKAYIGYEEDFVAFLDHENNLSKPLEDSVANLFLGPAFAVSKSLLNEEPPEDAVLAAKTEFNKSVRRALNSEVQSDADQFINWIYWDRDNLVLHK